LSAPLLYVKLHDPTPAPLVGPLVQTVPTPGTVNDSTAPPMGVPLSRPRRVALTVTATPHVAVTGEKRISEIGASDVTNAAVSDVTDARHGLPA